jgi:hypothetical protein
LKRLIVLLASTLAFLTAPAVAEAHWPAGIGSASWARGQTYEAWNHWCGNGDFWRCEDRISYQYESRQGSHSWYTYYCWVNRNYVTAAWKQWCVVDRVEHGVRAEVIRNRYVNAQS